MNSSGQAVTARTTPQEIREHLEHLRKAQDWSALLALTAEVLQETESDPKAVAAHVEALRNLDKYEDALEFLLTRGFADPQYVNRPDVLSTDFEVVDLLCTLLCEAGDYSTALDILRPLTRPLESARHELLNLRGWAHQNSYNETHAEEGLACYEAALSQIAAALKITDEEKDKQRRNQTLQLWYGKGYANALHRFPERQAEARKAYEAVLNQVHKTYPERPDPLALRIKAWCYYRIGELEKASEAYKHSLEAGVTRFSAQFDYALNLLAMGRPSASIQQYQLAIHDLEELGPLRRTGMLRVSLFELWDAASQNPNLLSAETKEVIERIFGKLTKSLDSFPPGLAKTAEAVRQSARMIRDKLASPECPLALVRDSSQIESSKPALTAVINWEATEISGFTYSNWTPCGLLPVVFTVPGSGGHKMEFVLAAETSGTDGTTQGVFERLDPSVRMCRARFGRPAYPNTRVMFLGDEFLEIAAIEEPQLRLTYGEDWKRVNEPQRGFAAPINVDQGNAILESLSRDLSMQVVQTVASSGSLRELPDKARMAVYAAPNEGSLYLAALCLILAGANGAEVSLLRGSARLGS